MSLTAEIVFNNERFLIGKDKDWFYVYENLQSKFVLVFESALESDVVSYVVNNNAA